ncbi:hypothetical protein LCGC14_3029980, partial [marine sediment metagenome]
MLSVTEIWVIISLVAIGLLYVGAIR